MKSETIDHTSNSSDNSERCHILHYISNIFGFQRQLHGNQNVNTLAVFHFSNSMSYDTY